MKLFSLFIAISLFELASPNALPQSQYIRAQDRVVRGFAVPEDDTGRTELYWTDARTDATGWKIYRKKMTDAWWPLDVNGNPVPVATLAGTARTWQDNATSTGGTIWEYWIEKQVSGYTANAYFTIGHQVAKVDYRGKVVLVYTAAGTPPQTFKDDIVGDGWEIIPIQVNESDPAPTVKSYIKTQYDLDPANVKAVILIGKVAVPYAGLFTWIPEFDSGTVSPLTYENSSTLNPPPPDYHNDHRGAWPSDAYYGDMDGSWTDTSTLNMYDSTRNYEPERNRVFSGDQKFDQSRLPSAVELAVGRIDFQKLRATFGYLDDATAESDQLSRYFQKNHAFKTGQFRDVIPLRGAISDDFQENFDKANASSNPWGDIDPTTSISGTAWANFSGFFGKETQTPPYFDLNVDYIKTRTTGGQKKNFFITLSGGTGALFSAAAGSGQFNGCGLDDSDGSFWIGRDLDYNAYSIKSVFVLLGGSYFGDWHTADNFLRSAIGSRNAVNVPSYTLATIWMGRPHLFLHHMLMGSTIGYSVVKTQNNGRNPDGSDLLYKVPDMVHFGLPARIGVGKTHLSLLGDPTLRMHIVHPVRNLAITHNPTSITLSWTHSLDYNSTPEFLGYHVYRSLSRNGPFTLQNPTPILTTTFTQSNPPAGVYYMVRALKYEGYKAYGEFGTYKNLSTGVIVQ